MNRINSLDGLRGLAAIGVAFFWHYQHFNPETFPFSRKAYWFYQYGYSLVDLFFILSGFIFCYVYKARLTSKSLGIKEYGVLRFSRLYPLHLLTLLLVALVQSIRHYYIGDYFVYQHNDTYHFILNLFFIQNGWFEHNFSFNAPTWSLSVEIIAYLLFFLIIYFLGSKEYYLVLYIAFVILGIVIKLTGLNTFLLNQETSRVFMGFFVGCLVYELYNYVRKIKTQHVFISIYSAVFLFLSISAITFGHGVLRDWQLVYTLIIFPLGILIILEIKIFNKILSVKPLAYLGEISFSIYLLHYPMQLVLKTLKDIYSFEINFSSRLTFVTFCISVIFVSILSHEFFEKPSQKYLRKVLLDRKNVRDKRILYSKS